MEQTIGAKIREFRKARGMTQKELGEKSGIAEPTIRRYELGKLNPKFETVKTIATALNVPAAIFFPIDEQTEYAKRVAKTALWAAEDLAKDEGVIWDAATYNRERKSIIEGISNFYSVNQDILDAFIPERPETGALSDANWSEPSPKEQAWNLFNAIPSDEKKKAAVQIAINDILNEYGKAPLPAFNRIMKSYGKNEPLTYKLVEDLEALIYDPSTDLDKK